MDGFGHAMKDRTKLQLHGLTSPAWKPAEIIKKIAQKRKDPFERELRCGFGSETGRLGQKWVERRDMPRLFAGVLGKLYLGSGQIE